MGFIGIETTHQVLEEDFFFKKVFTPLRPEAIFFYEKSSLRIQRIFFLRKNLPQGSKDFFL